MTSSILNSLPDESAIAAVTVVDWPQALTATKEQQEHARRQDRLQWAAATWDPIPFNAEAARTLKRFLPPAAGDLARRLQEPRRFLSVVAGPRQAGKTHPGPVLMPGHTGLGSSSTVLQADILGGLSRSP
jgi:hypothetical protein